MDTPKLDKYREMLAVQAEMQALLSACGAVGNNRRASRADPVVTVGSLEYNLDLPASRNYFAKIFENRIDNIASTALTQIAADVAVAKTAAQAEYQAIFNEPMP